MFELLISHPQHQILNAMVVASSPKTVGLSLVPVALPYSSLILVATRESEPQYWILPINSVRLQNCMSCDGIPKYHVSSHIFILHRLRYNRIRNPRKSKTICIYYNPRCGFLCTRFILNKVGGMESHE